jgi:predicted PolB exonuclease-like 3'-5' exonuclease
MKFKYKELSNILLIDVETVPNSPSFEHLSKEEKDLWAHKSKYLVSRLPEDEQRKLLKNLYLEKAGIFAEFSKIVCISVGLMIPKKKFVRVRLKSFYGDDEKMILQDFADLLEKYFNKLSKNYICGHNIKEFDIPFICRRMIKHQMDLPRLLDIVGLKPWETKHILDTMQLWKFGDYKNYTSLRLLAHVLDIPSPKEDIDGSMVGKVYWMDQDLERIVRYCEKDVFTVAEIMGKFLKLPPIERSMEKEV